MKTIQKQWHWLTMVVATAIVLLVHADNPCIDTAIYSSWSCFNSGAMNVAGTLDRTNITIYPGSLLIPPSWISSPTFTSGQELQTIAHTCSTLVEQNYSPVLLVPGSPYFVPPLFQTTNAPGTYLFTNKVDGLATSLAGWWPADGDTADLVFNNNGVVHGGVGYAYGMVGRAFTFNGVNSYIEITNGPAVNYSGPFTVEAWINYNTQPDAFGMNIISKGDDTAWSYVNWGLDISQNRKLRIYASSPYYYWNGYFLEGSTVLSPGTWYHVAITYDGNVLRGYINGSLEGAIYYGPIDRASRPFRIGALVPNDTGRVGERIFSGLIDEASYYSCALSASNLLAIYNAGSSGKNWGSRTNGAALPVSCVCSGVSGANNGTFTVVVTCPPPTITAQPVSQVVPSGTNVTFVVAAAGAAPLTYQWKYNGNNIAGATASSFTTNSVSLNSSGLYSVVVTNAGGTIPSLGVQLIVVGVSNVVVDSSNPEVVGATTVTAGSQSVLRAKSNPMSTGFPNGYPIWTITSQPSGSSLAAPPAGLIMVTNIPLVAGQYLFWAVCGNSSNSFALRAVDTNDLDYNGVPDNQELSMPSQTQLGSWRFDTSDWVGLQGQLPITFTNLLLKLGWYVGALEVRSNSGPAWLAYSEINTNTGVANLVCSQGSLRFMFRPDWSSTNSGGVGPGNEATLLEMGSKGTTNGCWGLYVGATGTNLYFCTKTNSASTTATTNLSALIKWTAGLDKTNWHQVTLTYSATNSALFIDGQLLTSGAGVSVWPGALIRSQGFHVGSTASGTNWAQGRFDNLETFNYVLSSAVVSNFYNSHPQPVRLTNFCNLAPIAISFQQAQGLTNGQVVTASIGTQNGNSTWLDWNGGNGSGPELIRMLNDLSLVNSYINPVPTNHADTLVTEDWVFANSGVNNSSGVNDALDQYTNSPTNLNPKTIGVVLWDDYTTSYGDVYEAAGFANIALISYNLSSGAYIKFKYLGVRSCNAYYPNVLPNASIVSPSDLQVLTVWNTNLAATLSITAAACDPEDGLTNIAFYSSTNAAYLGSRIYYQAITNSNTNLYTYNWTGAPHGTNYLTVTAQDEFGGGCTSAVVRAVVNWPPLMNGITNRTIIWDESSISNTISLNPTISDDRLPAGMTNLQWSVTSSNGPVWLSGTNQSSVTAAFRTNGIYGLRLTVGDGAATVTSNCLITILRRPFVTINLPTNNTLLNGNSNTLITVTATDLDGVITNVQFYNGNTSIGTNTGSSSSYTMIFTNISSRTNAFGAMAWDNDGLTNAATNVVVYFNNPPVVFAGAPQIISWPSNSVTLSGIVTDDQMPSGSVLTTVWSVVSSNGTVNFTNSYLTNSGVGFGTNGLYVLRLTASDTSATVNSNVTITINLMPQIIASNQIVNLTAANVKVNLGGSYYDDGLPVGAKVSPQWSVVSATAGSVTFSNATLPSTVATFTNNGNYVLQFSVNDTVSTNSTNVTITVNKFPSVTIQGVSPIIWDENASSTNVILTATVTDDGLPFGITNLAWSVVSSNGTVNFGGANSLTNQVTFTTNGVYVLKLSASDGFAAVNNTCTITILRRPFVGLLWPTNNSDFNYGTPITNSAFAYDLDGSITNRQFYYINNGVTNLITDLITVSGTNFTQIWNNPPLGTNQVFAIGVDNDGLTNRSAQNRVTVGNPNSTVQIAYPVNQVFPARTNILVKATASVFAPGVTITNVQFFVATNNALGITSPARLIGQTTNTIGIYYQTSWWASVGGVYVLTAKATDSRGSNVWSAPVTNLVRNLPVVTITAPVEGSYFYVYPTNITVTAHAASDFTNITKVEFYWDVTNGMATNTVNFTAGNSSTNWLVAASGTYTLRAVAVDGTGARGSSTNITIFVVSNQPPSVYAGPDQTNNLSTNAVQFPGIVMDDGLLANHPLTISWTNISGPASVPLSATNFSVTYATFSSTGVYQFVLSANDGQYIRYSTNTITVLTSNMPPVVTNAWKTKRLILPALENTNPVQTIKLTQIGSVPFNGPKGIDYYEPSNCVVISSGDYTNFSLAFADGETMPFKEVDSAKGDETYIATVRNTLGGFQIGEMFAVNGAYPGEVLRIKPDGTLVGNVGANNNAWVVLSNADGYIEPNDLRGGLWVDRTGVWGGDLVVASFGGNIWRVNSNGVSTLVAQLNGGEHYEGITTVPNNVIKYGPWAGKVLVGGDSAGSFFAVDTNGFSVRYDFPFGAEDIRVIPENENFFGIGDGVPYLTGAASSEFQGMEGDILVASEDGSGIHRIYWDGAKFQFYTIASTPNWEQVNFAPAGFVDIPLVNYVQLGGSVFDDGRITNTINSWIKASGPGPVIFDDPSVTNTIARFSQPGTNYLRLSAYDGQFTSSYDVRVDVVRNQAPVVDAGTNQVIATNSTTLYGTVGDDGLPYGTTNIFWECVSIPDSGCCQAIPVNSGQAVTAVIFTNTCGGSINGTYVLRLTVSDRQATRTSEVSITVGTTNITMTPAYGWPTLTNTSYTVTAHVVNPTNGPVSNQQVLFEVNGANNQSWTTNTDANGNVQFIYIGTSPGRDIIKATVVGGTQDNNSDGIKCSVVKDWAIGMACDSSQAHSSTSIGCLSMDWPTNDARYADYYYFDGVAGETININELDDGNWWVGQYQVGIILRDPQNRVIASSIGASGPNGYNNYCQLAFVLPQSGSYLIEVVNLIASSSYYGNYTPNYQLGIACNGDSNPVPIPAPQLRVLYNGTNIPSGGVVVFPQTVPGQSNNVSILITNSGSADLSINSVQVNGDFTLTNDVFNSTTVVPSLGATNWGIRFNATSNGVAIGQLAIHNNASVGGYYVVYLVGYAFPAGAPPSIVIDSSITNQSYFTPATIPITTLVTNGSANVSYVLFQLLTTNGTVNLGSSTNIVNHVCTWNWLNVPDGTYAITATAVDADGRSSIAAPVTVLVQASNGNQPPAAEPYQAFIPAGRQNYFLNPLQNDSDPDGDVIKIVSVGTNHLTGATFSIVNNGTGINYNAPSTLPAGYDWFTYQISDGRGGLATSYIQIGIHPPKKPEVEIMAPVDSNSPNNYYQTNVGAIVPITALVSPYTYVTNVVFYEGEEVIGIVTNGVNGYYTLTNWAATYSACGCGINAQANDQFGQVGSSGLIYIDTNGATLGVNSGLLALSINSEVGSSQTNDFSNYSDSMVTIRDGIFDLYGTAYHQEGSNIVWQLGIYNISDGSLVRDLTPLMPRDKNGACTDPRGSSTQIVTLATNCDLTTVQNGIYDLILSSSSGGIHNEVTVRFRLESSLKLGQFGFSQSDLVIPVNGIPLTIVRTYNSINSDKGDFGYSWTWALNDMDVQIDETRQDAAGTVDDYSNVGDPESYEEFSQRSGGGHDVTLTLPNGQRTTFYYHPSYQGPNEIPAWDTAPGIPAGVKLEAQGSPQYQPWGQGWVRGGMDDDYLAPYDTGDFEGFILTMPDKTQYKINRPDLGTYDMDEGYIIHAYGKPYLAEIDQPSGDRITIDSSAITHYDAHNQTRQIVFHRNAEGLIDAISDPIAQETSGLPYATKYEYDYNDNLIAVEKLVDRSNSIYVTNSFVYANPNFPHYITQIIDPRGVPVARQLYDDSGRLIGIIDAAGKTNSFAYDLNAKSETTYDQLGNPTVNFYDSRGNVTATVDALGRQTSRTFDDNGYVTSVADALHHTNSFTYDQFGNQTSVVDALGHTNYSAYDGNDQLVAVTNALGYPTHFQYDDHGNQTNTVDALSHNFGVVYNGNSQPTTITDPFGRTNATATYDALGNVAAMTDTASGATTSFAYDANGNQTDNTNLWVNPSNPSDIRTVASHSVYDAQGRETTSTDPDGLSSTVAYDADGRQNQLLDEYNRTSGWVYDARGNLIQISFPDGSITRMIYDDVGRMSVTDSKHLPGTVVNGTRTTFDVVGQVVKSEQLTNLVIDITTDANGVGSSSVTSIGGVISTSTYGYDDAGRQMAVTNGFGAVTRYAYDAAGNQTAVIDALSNRTDNVYDPAGHLIFTTNALHQVTQYVYDELGRSVKTIFPDGSYTATAYDAVGNRVAETNQLMQVTTYLYDDASRMTNISKPSVFDPESGTPKHPQWGFAFDGNGQMKSVSDPKLRTTSFTYDQLGRTVTHTLPLLQTGSQAYDGFGRVSRKVDFKGQTNEFVYNAIGQLATNRFYAAGSSTASQLAAYIYDSEDRTKQINEPRGTNGFIYDNQGHVLQVATPEGALNYEYEPVEGRRVRLYTANSDIRYGYDLLGRIQTVSVFKRDGTTLTTPEVTTNGYTALGSLQDVYYPNGVHAAYQYDLMNRLTNLTYITGSSVLLAQYVYAPNTNGQWRTATEIQRQVNGTYLTNQLAWGYDNLGRLTNEACGSTLAALNYTNRYVYNLVGNRLWQTNLAGSTTTVIGYSYNDNDQLLKEVTTINGSASGTFTNWYDVNGSLTNRTSATETNLYSYNLQNKLATAIISRTEAGHSLSETINYTYDYKGSRVKAQWVRSVDGGANINGTNIFLKQENQIFEEFPVIGATPTVSYTLGQHGQSRGGTNTYLLSDGHGSTRQLADTNASIITKYSYDAYGKGLDFTNAALNPTMTSLLYSGEEQDRDLQLYNLQARYYNSTIGGFNQIDPFSGNQQSGANLYDYGADDPVNNSDPSGMYEIDVHQFLTQFLAQEAGFAHPVAVAMGKSAQRPDGIVTPTKIDESLSAFDGKAVNQRNMRLYHFVSRGQLMNLAVDAKVNQTGMDELGEFFHAQEDTFAHSSKTGGRDFHYHGDWFGMQNGGKYGHGPEGHKPDQTWRDLDKAMMMARQVFGDLEAIHADPQQRYPFLSGRNPCEDDSMPDPKWDGIKGKVQEFVMFRPHVVPWVEFSGHKFELGGLGYETVTFGGYNEKIAVFESVYPDKSYQVDPMYRTVFPTDTGYKSGNYFGYKAKAAISSIGDAMAGIGSLGGFGLY
jgi:RHS repeat-associated protein